MESRPECDSSEIESVHLVPHVEPRQDQIASMEERSRKNGCIFTVSESIREGNEKLFTPIAVAIGPLHRAKFITKEKVKAEYSNAFIQKYEMDREAVCQEITYYESDLRKCYVEPYLNCNSNSHEFVEMMIIDGCFLMQRLLRKLESKNSTASEELQDRDIWEDIPLIENQVPILVLEKIYVFTRRKPNRTFLEVIFNYFKQYNNQQIEPRDVRTVHFVDLLRHFLLPPRIRHGGSEQRTIHIVDLGHSASELLRAGVDFQTSESRCLWDINLQGRVLKIPIMEINDKTERYLSNVLAYEERCYRDSQYVLEYFYTLKFLVREEKDAKILNQKGIIVSLISHAEVVSMLQRVSSKSDIHTMSSKYQTLCENLNTFAEKPDNKAKVKIVRKCGGTTRMKITTILGVLAFVVVLAVFIWEKIKESS